MDNQADKDGFSEILRKLEEKMLYYESKASRQRKDVLNRINLEGFKAIQRKYTEDRSLCKKYLEIEGIWRLGVQYGPQFETHLRTEKAGAILVQTDETTLLGGGGTAIHPISLCMAGFGGCFTAAFAKWAAMQGIELKTLKIRAKADIDLTTSFGIEDYVPMIDSYHLDFFIESDTTMEKLREIVELTKLRCFCYYCAATPIFPTVLLNKEYTGLEDRNSKKLERDAPKSDDYMLNRINVNGFREIQRKYSQNRSLCKKVLDVEGTWRLDVEYGPQYQTTLPTERAGDILIQTDETTILGGGGTSFHPVHLCMAGLAGNFSAAFAKWAAFAGIELRSMKIKVKQYIDLTTGFGIEDYIPMIDNYQIELTVDSDASVEKLLEILELTKKRCFCHYCLITPTIPIITVHKIISNADEKTYQILKKEVISDAPLSHINNNLLFKSIFNKRKIMKMRKI
ncbi:MAG: OsmC family protein [Candidatus Odinarchaeota archaeon]